MVNQLSALLRRTSGPLVVIVLIALAGLSLGRVYNGPLLFELVAGAAVGALLGSVGTGVAKAAMLGIGDQFVRDVVRTDQARPQLDEHLADRRFAARDAAGEAYF